MRQILSLFLLLLLPLAALADGIFIPPVAFPAKISIPDQRALICYSNGTERLVIETRFTGSGTNFAWVVPLPSQPIVEEATTGLFPTLQYLFRPQIIHDVPHYYAGILALIGIGYLLCFVRPTGQLKWTDILACICVGAGAASASHREIFNAGSFLFVTVVMLGGVVLIRIGQNSPLSVFGLMFLLFFCLAGLFLPAASRGINPMVSADGISILDRKIVGILETTTIGSHDARALQGWLSENGYAIPTNSAPVVAGYVKDGWVFVAMKVRRANAAPDTSTPQPVSFTFRTDKPVYPMRLTGLNDRPLRVDLYIFSAGRTEAPHFKVVSCTRPNIVHPLLHRWTAGLPVANKLTATLSPADMRQDVWLEQTPLVFEHRDRLFSYEGALITAMNWGTGFFGVGLVMFGILAFAGENNKIRFRQSVGVLTIISTVVVGLSYLCVPKIEVKLVSRFPYYNSGEEQFTLRMALDDLNWQTSAEARAGLREIVSNPTNAASYDLKNWDNNFVGGQIHEEDSPGNYLLRETNGQLQFVAFDANGAEAIIGAWNLTSPH